MVEEELVDDKIPDELKTYPDWGDESLIDTVRDTDRDTDTIDQSTIGEGEYIPPVQAHTPRESRKTKASTPSTSPKVGSVGTSSRVGSPVPPPVVWY